jgi:hypothetical protein
MAEMSEVLPAPICPMTATREPRRNSKLMSRRTSSPSRSHENEPPRMEIADEQSTLFIKKMHLETSIKNYF